MDYTHNDRKWDEQGVPFRSHLYVPEVHPVTNSIFHVREDEGHMLKVHACIIIICHLGTKFYRQITSHLKGGGIKG